MSFRIASCAGACLALLGCCATLQAVEAEFGAGRTATAATGDYVTTVAANVDLNKAAADLAAAYDAEVTVVSPGLRVLRVEFGADADEKGVQKATASKKVAGVGKLEPNYLRTLHAAPIDGPEVLPGDNYIYTVTDAYEAWDVQTDARDVIVAVIDSGVAYTHPDLAENIWINRQEVPNNLIDDDRNGFVDDTIGWDMINNDNDPFPDFPYEAHGTHVAGTIGAFGDTTVGVGFNGVCWRARIMPLLVFDETGFTTSAAIVAAIEYAVRNGARVINMSLGGYGYNAAEESAIEFARSRGVIVVCSAGNGGDDGIGDDNDYLLKNYPSGYPQDNIISVSASGFGDTLTIFSNYGFSTVDIAAPGEAVLSTWITPTGILDYDYLDGTSMAAPMVSGAATLVWSEHLNESYSQIRSRILDAADRLGQYEGTNVTGGRLNIRKAIGETTFEPTIDFRLNGYYANYYSSLALQYSYPAYYYGGLDYNVYLGYLYSYYAYLTGTYVGYRVAYDTDTFDANYAAYKSLRAQQYQLDGYAAYFLYSADAYTNNGNLDVAAATAYYAYLFAQYDLSY